jgi:dTMP kinase
MRGRLIVFEGVEGCGKTTQLERSQDWLHSSGILSQLQTQGLISDLILTREPGGTEICQAIRQLLLQPTTTEPIHSQTELLLYAADRAQHVAGLLRPKLAAGAFILCDRYTDSTVAYQGYGRQLDRALIDQLNQIATGGLQSDLTLWVDVPVETGLARAKRRGESDRIEQATIDFHHRVQQGFTELAQREGDRIHRIDGTASVETVAATVQAAIWQRLQQWYPGLAA